jgi:hypothetical protein
MKLKDAIKTGRLDEFIAEHENDPPGDPEKAKAIIRHMMGTAKAVPAASTPAASDDCSGTRIPPRTSGGASSRRGRGSRGSSS